MNEELDVEFEFFVHPQVGGGGLLYCSVKYRKRCCLTQFTPTRLKVKVTSGMKSRTVLRH